jgi:hypothetical protein
VTFLTTLTSTLGLPDARTMLLNAPPVCHGHWLETIQQWVDWTLGITELLPDAVWVEFSTSSEYDDEGGYYTLINWWSTKILDEHGNDLTADSDDLGALVESLQNLESDLGYPSCWGSTLDLRTLPTKPISRDTVVSNLEAWITMLKQLPDDAFSQATP